MKTYQYKTLRIMTLSVAAVCVLLPMALGEEKPETRTYQNRLVKIEDPGPLLADYPKWVQPVREVVHYESPALVKDEKADLSVRAWRFCYNARGIIEIPKINSLLFGNFL